ncbi:MAG: peroxide stress protein YaaA [Bacteroidales bacterium]|jgi:cytoplasmic iron level regulating protein YaaA (DUF328/UPF0246 family)|nr:peroxide stress protein YaaA [Bacteroidales bacterium]
MITVISPAKTLDFKRDVQTKQYSQPYFLKDSEVLIKELRKLNPKDIVRIMKVSNDIAFLNFERNLSWRIPFTIDNAKQAILAFNGQVFIGLNSKTLTENELLFAQDNFRILSGLYGALKPLDLMQAYRLEMGIPLKNPRGKNLYEFWGTKITETINSELQDHKYKVLINLASKEYYKVIKPKLIKGEIITPVFKEEKGSNYKVIAVYAKNARGLMSRFIIQNGIENPEDIKAFDSEDYLYNQDLSTENEWVFTR